MTTRNPGKEAIDTRLIRVITLLYSMLDDDIARIQEQITQQLTITYRQTISAQLRLYGCQKLVTGPDGKAQTFIETKAKADATSIANTYNRELRAEVQRIYTRNPRGNRYYFIRALEEWTARRNAYKIPQISLNTATAAREYAAQRFRRENNIEGRMVFVGPPPVCKKCLRLKGLGPVSVAAAERYGDSQHINCPHRWEQLIAKPIPCDELTWTG